MHKNILLILVIAPTLVSSQIAIKAGLNFANVSKVSSINNSSRTGFHAGLAIVPSSKRIIGSRTEILFSRQGYNYKSGTNTGSVDLNYIMLPQYMTIRITKYLELQVGAQMAFLLNAHADSTQTSGMPGPGGKIMDYYNRFDYGYGGGIEVHPVRNLMLGARFNVSLGELYKTPEPGQVPSFIPEVDVKNNLFMLYLGWRFGGK